MIWECRHCGEFVGRDQEPDNARCPRCREPLFEKEGGPRLVTEQEATGKGMCASHPGNAAVGTCKRCGNFFCPVCRTRWQDRALCLACVQRILTEQGENFAEKQAHQRQAMLGFMMGLLAWVLVVLGGLCLMIASAARVEDRMVILAFLMIMGSLLLSALGIGQAAAAVRSRGSRMLLATSGLVLSGLHLGCFLGILLLAVSRT